MQSVMKLVFLGLLLVLASGHAVASDTLDSIYKRKIDLGGANAAGNADEKALRAYENYLRQNPNAARTVDAKHRLADLRLRTLIKQQDNSVNNEYQLRENQNKIAGVISLYQKILKQHPTYAKNDDVLYQMARAYETIGRPKQAVSVLQSLIKRFPQSTHYDESQFRLGEIYFAQANYMSSLSAYKEVIKYGESSQLYNQALFKAGWSLFKDAKYEKSLNYLLQLMDIETRRGLDGKMVIKDRQNLENTLRIVALNFYYLGGANTINGYLKRSGGPRPYEALIYDRLSKLYLEKDIFIEAAQTYKSYLGRNRFSKQAPKINLKVIALYDQGGYTDDVLREKGKYARAYDLDSKFWKFYKPADLPEVVEKVKATMRELSQHYYATWQETGKKSDFNEAVKWYKDYLDSFKEGQQVYDMSFEFAELYYENKNFYEASKQFENTAYGYNRHTRAADAGFASLQAYEKHIKSLRDKDQIATATITSVNSYLKFAYTFPQHEKAPTVVKTAAQRLYEAEDYEQAADVAQMFIERYLNAGLDEQREAWSLLAASSFKGDLLDQAEHAYNEVLGLTDPSDKRYEKALDQLAATIYQQGVNAQEDDKIDDAIAAFSRVKQKAPFSDLAITAQYDVATLYAKQDEFGKSIKALEELRRTRPGNKFSDDIVRKLAAMYERDRQFSRAAEEFLAIGRTDPNQQTQRDATMKAGRLFDKAGEEDKSLAVFREFTERFPQPVDEVIEVMNDIAQVYKEKGNRTEYYAMLKKIILADNRAGASRNNRTKLLAARATIGIATPRREAYERQLLTLPLDQSVQKKQKLFQSAVKAYELANTFGVSEITTESTYYVGNIYYDFSKALMDSERPAGLSEMELEQYSVLLEDQAYPFEEQAITLLEANTKRMREQGVYDKWVKKSIDQLAQLLPFKYNKKEQLADVIEIIAPAPVPVK